MLSPITDWLSIGGYRDCLNTANLKSLNIRAVLQLADFITYSEMAFLYIPVTDGEEFDPQKLAQGMAFVAQQRAQGHPILIACGAGISRSATFCMAALKEQHHMSLLEAYQLIKQHHPIAFPHPDLLKTLCQYYPDETPLETLRAAVMHSPQP